MNKDDPFAKLPEMHDPPITELESTIGQNIANLVPDGATLQGITNWFLFYFVVGIGAIPNAVLKCLHNHKNLGIHSEMISNGVMVK